MLHSQEVRALRFSQFGLDSFPVHTLSIALCYGQIARWHGGELWSFDLYDGRTVSWVQGIQDG